MVVQSCRGMLRIQIPSHVSDRRYLYLGLPDTPLNRRAAEQKAEAIAADIAFNRFDTSLKRYQSLGAADNSPSLRELWNKYQSHKERSLSQSTISKDFKRIGNHIDALPSQRLKDARKIRTYLLETLTPSSTKKILMHLTACCDWAVQEDLIQDNPFKKLGRVSSGRKSKGINPFTKAEIDLIVTEFGQHPQYKHYTTFVEFLFFTGCRTSEAIGLQWKHVSPDLTTITFSEALVLGSRKGTKTGAVRKFPVNRQLRFLLSKIKPANAKPDDLVFRSPNGLPIDSHNFLNRAWRSILSNLPIDYRPQYNTRHSFITLCLEAGIQVQQVASWVGNSPKTIWQHYAGLTSKQDVPEIEL